MPDISIRDLNLSYKGKKKKDPETVVFNRFFADFHDGKINVVVGYNGCGKSTLLKCIAGIVNYTGQVLFDGEDLIDIKRKDRDIAFVRENFILNPMMTIFDNIAFALAIYKLPREDVLYRVRKIARDFGIEHCLNCKPKQLSVGQQQRAAIARALVKEPSICLFDEAFSNLDLKLRDELRHYIKKLQKETKMTVIYVTHDFQEAMLFSDYLYVMKDGQIVEEGLPKDVLKSGNEFVDQLYRASVINVNKDNYGD